MTNDQYRIQYDKIKRNTKKVKTTIYYRRNAFPSSMVDRSVGHKID